MKKHLTMILALLFTVVQGTWAWEGSGTEADPYLISSLDDWKTLCTNVNNGEPYRGVYFKLMADLTGLKEKWNVGDENRCFEGTFDGNNHTVDISNFFGGSWAPFRYVRNATIKRLHVTGKLTCGSSAGGTYHGGVVAIAYGNNTLVACHSSVEFKLSDSYNAGFTFSQSGGLVG